MKNETVTIDDISKAAGVSKTTVSRYINGKYELISPATRERIETVIRVTNYHPNIIAQTLKSSQSKQIGVVISDISAPFFATLIQGVSDVLIPAGYTPLFVSCNNNAREEEIYIKSLLSRKVDGLIVNTSSCYNPNLIKEACNGLPIVLCDRLINDYNFNFVGAEHSEPIFRLVAHLREQGFGYLAYFTEEYKDNSTRLERRSAFISALEKYYPQLDGNSMVYTIDINDTEKTELYLQQLIERCPSGQRPVVFCGNTLSTLQAMGGIRRLGLSIPDDIGICGVDDWGWGNRSILQFLLDPGITSIVVSPYTIGKAAAEKLLSCIADPHEEKTDIRFPCDLEYLGSTKLK